MAVSGVLTEIERERLAVADLLDTLTPEQLATPSYCGEWTVHEVGAHLLMPLRTSTLALLGAVVRTGSPDKANDRITEAATREEYDHPETYQREQQRFKDQVRPS